MSFDYEENRCYLEALYDEVEHTVTLRGGLHAMAYLAELCAYNVEMKGDAEHDHWDLVTPGSLAFTLIFRETLPK